MLNIKVKLEFFRVRVKGVHYMRDVHTEDAKKKSIRKMSRLPRIANIKARQQCPTEITNDSMS